MLPTFIIVGAEKCGTTSLYHYVKQHPEVFMCTPKEPDFFSGKDFVTTLEAYEALFDSVTNERAIGEASVGYLWSKQAAERIKETLPDIRLIVVLRDPADRAYSHYNMLVQKGVMATRPYMDVLIEAQRTGNFFGTGIPTSYYFEPLQYYFDLFGRDQLRVYLFRDFKKDTLSVMRCVFSHIGIDPTFTPAVGEQHNKAYLPKNTRIDHFLRNDSNLKSVAKAFLPVMVRSKLSEILNHKNRSAVAPLSSEARRLIIDMLLDDIEKTEALLGFDLSAWKS